MTIQSAEGGGEKDALHRKKIQLKIHIYVKRQLVNPLYTKLQASSLFMITIASDGAVAGPTASA